MSSKIDPTLHRPKKPDWIKVRLPSNPVFFSTKALISDLRLHTVCESAQCPNRWECWSQGTAARDDLADGGAAHFANTILAIRNIQKGVIIEVLVPDFNGKEASIETVLWAEPDIFNHNLETVERLTPAVRSRAKYRISLQVLKRAKQIDPAVVTKSGIMLGLGETENELFQALDDLREAGVQVLTMGQYLRPSPKHLPVVEYVTPETFELYREIALKKGFEYVASGPLVRSSYHAADYHPVARRGTS